MNNSTFSDNSTIAGGMALDLFNGHAYLHYVTIVNNSSTGSGSTNAGLVTNDDLNIRLRNSILSDNERGNGSNHDCYGAIDTRSNNLINDANSNCNNAANETGDPDLGDLSGGVYPLNSGSPALNAASCLSSINRDQRGKTRATSGSNCEMGAWEAQPPDKPSAPSLTAGNTQISVSVSAPTANDFAIGDYQVRVSTDAASWGDPTSAGSSGSFTITSLTNGTTYYVQVRASSAAGNGPWSDSSSAAPAAGPTNTPGPSNTPTNTLTPSNTPVPSNTPTNTPVPPTSTPTNTLAPGVTPSDTPPPPTKTSTPLPPSNTPRPSSTPRPTATDTPIPRPPDTPDSANLTAANAGIRGVISPPNDNGKRITSYRYRWSTDGSDWSSRSTRSTNFTITGLQNDITYYVEVSATNADGSSNWSAPAVAMPDASLPRIATAVPPDPDDERSSSSRSDEASPSPTVDLRPPSGETLNQAGYSVDAAHGLASGAEFRQVGAAGVGNQSVLDRGVLDAVDVYGWVDQGVTVCFPQVGALIFLDAENAPRVPSDYPSYANENGMTCADLNRAGTLALVKGEPSGAAFPGYLRPIVLDECMVRLTEYLNFRRSPAGEIMRVLPPNVELTALQRVADWYFVDYLGERGWVSADYAQPLSDCGQ